MESHPEGLRHAKKYIPWPSMSSKEYMEGTIWIDEAGMGSLAGPLYIGGAFMLDTFNVEGIHDSKLLNEKERNRVRDEVAKSGDHVIVHVESITASELDSMGGLGEAWKEGIVRTVNALIEKVTARFPVLNWNVLYWMATRPYHARCR